MRGRNHRVGDLVGLTEEMYVEATEEKQKPSAPARFKVGDLVRVKPGVRDEEQPDIPLGGWAGDVSEIHRRGIYTVRWSRETLSSIHPVYRKRCAIEGMMLEDLARRGRFGTRPRRAALHRAADGDHAPPAVGRQAGGPGAEWSSG